MFGLWQMWEAGVDDESVEKINKLAELFPLNEAQTGHVLDPNSGSRKDVRSSKIRWIDKKHNDALSLVQMLHKLFEDANNAAFGVDWRYINDIQHTLYEAKDKGHYNFHIDTFFEAPVKFHRKLSMTIQLSDSKDYEGGDFKFYDPIVESPDPDKLRAKGTVLVFPSFLPHAVTPVTKGERKSLVVWADGPELK